VPEREKWKREPKMGGRETIAEQRRAAAKSVLNGGRRKTVKNPASAGGKRIFIWLQQIRGFSKVYEERK